MVAERVALLARHSEEPGRLTRRFGTAAHAAAADTVAGWMRDAGLEVRRDPIGNVIGRRGAGPALMLGSHIDTVPDAGRYDGALGVLAAIEVARRAGALPFALEVVAFADEEGARFGTAYLGSSAMAGCFETGSLAREDLDGVTLEEAIRALGGDPARLGEAAREPGSLVGYAELHIEQGPVLEERGEALGVVTGIAGQSRAALAFAGAAGHAGTVPMELRRDALCAAAEMTLAVEALARPRLDLVATVGSLVPLPGAPNVIPGRCELTLDVRHPEDAPRHAAVAQLQDRAGEIAAARGLELEWELLHEHPAVRCDPELTELMAAAVGGHPPRLASGAGHDAAMMARVAPVAMLFVRCAGGVSHHPDESVEAADMAAATDALARFVEAAAARYGPGQGEA